MQTHIRYKNIWNNKKTIVLFYTHRYILVSMPRWPIRRQRNVLFLQRTIIYCTNLERDLAREHNHEKNEAFLNNISLLYSFSTFIKDSKWTPCPCPMLLHSGTSYLANISKHFNHFSQKYLNWSSSRKFVVETFYLRTSVHHSNCTVVPCRPSAQHLTSARQNYVTWSINTFCLCVWNLQFTIDKF